MTNFGKPFLPFIIKLPKIILYKSPQNLVFSSIKTIFEQIIVTMRHPEESTHYLETHRRCSAQRRGSSRRPTECRSRTRRSAAPSSCGRRSWRALAADVGDTSCRRGQRTRADLHSGYRTRRTTAPAEPWSP